MDRVPAAFPAKRDAHESGTGRGRQNLRNLFQDPAEASPEYQIIRPPIFQLAASGLGRALVFGRADLYLAHPENRQAGRGAQHAGDSSAQWDEPDSLGRNKRSSAIQVSAHSKSLVDPGIRRKDAHALDSAGTTLRRKGGGRKLCPGKPSDT